jgi:hypothetical protein
MMHRYWKAIVPVAALAIVLVRPGAAEPPSAEEIRQAVDGHTSESVSFFREFLALPNDTQYPAAIETLVSWMGAEFSRRGFRPRTLPTPGSAVLYADRMVEGASKTVLVYLQADGQPVDPPAWDQENPYLSVDL